MKFCLKHCFLGILSILICSCNSGATSQTLSLNVNNTKTEFALGEVFSSKGLVVELKNGSNYQKLNEEQYVIDSSKFDSTKEGEYVIDVSFKENSALKSSYNVEVIKIPVSLIEIETNKSLITGDTYKLNPKVYPENASDKSLSWTSSDINIVQVTNDGTIIAKNEGFADVVAYSNSTNNVTATCKVVVSSKIIEVEDIILKENESILVGNTIKLDARVVPNDATYQELSWSSEDEEIASVSSDGIVTGISQGVTNIVVRAPNNVFKKCLVSVNYDYVPVEDIFLDKLSLDLIVGEESYISVTISPSTATNQKIYWHSDNSSVCEVIDGKVTALNEGIGTIIASSEDKGISKYCTVNVYQGEIPVQDVFLDKTALALAKLDSYKLTYNIVPYNASDKKVFWKSTNNNVATVSDEGVITATEKGEVDIIITTQSSEISKKCHLVVVDNYIPISEFSFSETTMKVSLNETAIKTLSIMPISATNKKFNIITSNPEIASVSLCPDVPLEFNISPHIVGETDVIAISEDQGLVAKGKIVVSSSSQIDDFGIVSDIEDFSNLLPDSLPTIQYYVSPSTDVIWKISNLLYGNIASSGLLTLSEYSQINGARFTIYAISKYDETLSASLEIEVASFDKLDKTKLLSGEAKAIDTNIIGKVIIPSSYYNASVGKRISITKIKKDAFSSCINMNNISIPNSMINVNVHAFDNCPSLIYFYSNGYFYLGNSLNHYLVLIKVSNDISNVVPSDFCYIIPDYMFYDSNSVYTFTFPSNLSVIGESTFEKCHKLYEIIFKEGKTNLISIINKSAFAYCDKLEISDWINFTNLQYIGENAFNGVGIKKFDNFDKIPVSVISEYAFSHLDNFSGEVVLPCTLNKIMPFAFNFSNIESFRIENNPSFITYNGVLYSYSKSRDQQINYNSLILYPSGKTESSFSLEFPIKEIASGAFSSNPYLKMAFFLYTDEKQVYSTSLKKIGDSAFMNCSSLGIVFLPKSITYIGNNCYYNCKNLEAITFEGDGEEDNDIETIGSQAFYNCALSSVNYLIGSKTKKIGTGAFYSSSEREKSLKIKFIDCSFSWHYYDNKEYIGTFNPEGGPDESAYIYNGAFLSQSATYMFIKEGFSVN